MKWNTHLASFRSALFFFPLNKNSTTTTKKTNSNQKTHWHWLNQYDWLGIIMVLLIFIVPQSQPAATVPTNEHANGKPAPPPPVPTSIPGSIQDYKGNCCNDPLCLAPTQSNETIQFCSTGHSICHDTSISARANDTFNTPTSRSSSGYVTSQIPRQLLSIQVSISHDKLQEIFDQNIEYLTLYEY